MIASKIWSTITKPRSHGFGRQLELAKQAFSEQVAKTLTVDLHHLVEQLKTQMFDQIAAALLPVLRHVLTESAIRELVRGVRELAPDDQTMKVEVSGPEELLRRVEESYWAARESQPDGTGPSVKFVPRDDFEVQARVNDTLIETRLMEWIGKIVEAGG